MNRRSLHSGSTEEPRPLASGGAGELDEQAAAKLLERYAIAEPDDLTVERVWQRLANPRSSSRFSGTRLTFLVMAPAALAWAVLLGLIVFRGPSRAGAPPARIAPASQSAELGATRGGVFFSRPAERWQPGLHGQALAEGEWLRTDPTGMAVLNIAGVASVLIAPGTDLGLDRFSTGTFLRLSRGSVTARVSKRPPGDPFVILTDRFSVKVVGTLFEVDQDANDRTLVAVREGTVEIAAADGRSWRVGAGQRWVSSAPTGLGASTIADSVRALLEDGLRGANAADLGGELEAMAMVSAVSEASAKAESARAAGVDVAPAQSPPSFSELGAPSREANARRGGGLASRTESSNALGNPRASPASAAAAATASSPAIVLAEREPMVRAPAAELSFEKAPAPTTASAANGDGAYSKGLALERGGQLEEAAAELARAESDDPDRADLALYALGRLYQHRLGNSQGALAAFGRYRSHYPQGALLPEVDLAILEVKVEEGDRKDALAESIRFLASHPASERTDEVRLLRGNLLRDSGECGTALGEYAEVKASAFTEAALYGTARCQGKLGNWSAEREALRAYRKLFPTGAHRDEVAKELAVEFETFLKSKATPCASLTTCGPQPVPFHPMGESK